VEGAEEVFGRDGKREAREQEALVADLYEQIGRLQMELEWTKKKAAQVELRRNGDGSNRNIRV